MQAIVAPWSRLRAELGARFDHWGNNNGIATVQIGAGAPTTTEFENRGRDAFSPRIGLRLIAMPTLSFHTAAYQAFRAPNLAELYRRFNSGATQSLPNPALKPEFATGYEAGFDWQPLAWMQVKGTAYNADMRDFNTFVTIATNQRQRQNIQKTRSKGGEAYVALRPIQSLFVSGSINYDDDKIVSNGANTASIGTRVGRVPVQKEVVRVTYNTPAFGSWTVIGRHEGVVTTLQGVPLEPFTVVDANVQREIRSGLNGFVSVENIGDTKYQISLTSLNNGVASLGMPLTVRVGLEAYRF
jgi:outer membrane receptor protein involved in Fe transport